MLPGVCNLSDNWGEMCAKQLLFYSGVAALKVANTAGNMVPRVFEILI